MGRFKRLVESKKVIEKFIAGYRIPNTVGLRYCKEGEWHFMRQEGDVSWQFGSSSFVLGHFFLLGVGLGLDMKWAKVVKFFGPTIAPQNPAARLLGQRGGF